MIKPMQTVRHEDSRGVAWEIISIFNQSFAKSARGEQIQSTNVTDAKAAIERAVAKRE